MKEDFITEFLRLLFKARARKRGIFEDALLYDAACRASKIDNDAKSFTPRYALIFSLFHDIAAGARSALYVDILYCCGVMSHGHALICTSLISRRRRPLLDYACRAAVYYVACTVVILLRLKQGFEVITAAGAN